MSTERARATDAVCSIQKFDGLPPKESSPEAVRVTPVPKVEEKVVFQPSINFKEEA